jgi:NAD(P)-dependent dehydrogenase (short-subunit alcohol dehydrogenase family)
MITWEFTDSRVLVTGATSGIGLETAKLMVKAGGSVAAIGRSEEALSELAGELEAEKGTVHPVCGDLTDNSFRQTLIDETIGNLGGLDILVNAAGIIASADWDTTSLEDWDFMMDINLRSLFALTKLAIPHLIGSGGSIVNVSSVTGIRAFPGVLAYCVSKAGVDQFTRCLAMELAPSGVRVNAVNPGVTVTNLHRRGGMDEEKYAGFLEHSKTTHPLGRVGQPEEVADLIAFLASKRSGWITGETVAIDGGRHQTCAR